MTIGFPPSAELQAARHAAKEAGAYLREEADFNRSWTDGRRRALFSASPAYIARRIEIAETRERWADAIEMLLAPDARNP